MSGWPILDVAIGLAFVYLLLSTICTSLTEGIESQLRSRSKFLSTGIATLLGDSAEATKDFYSHAVIASFTHHEGDSVIRKIFRWVVGKWRETPVTDHADQRPAYLPGDKFAVVVREMVNSLDSSGNAKYPNLVVAVKSVLAGTKTEEEEIQALGIWYDQVMERVSGWYKRHAQAWVRTFAVVVVIVLNADTLQITNLLWMDPALRQQVVDQASARVKQPPPETVAVDYTDSDETDSEDTPENVGTTGDSSDKHLGVTSQQWQVLNQVGNWQADRDVLDQTLAAWEANRTRDPNAGSNTGVYVKWVGYLLRRHGLGWFLSMVAVSLGAPFWFGALNRLVNIRNAGKAPAKQTETAAN